MKIIQIWHPMAAVCFETLYRAELNDYGTVVTGEQGAPGGKKVKISLPTGAVLVVTEGEGE